MKNNNFKIKGSIFIMLFLGLFACKREEMVQQQIKSMKDFFDVNQRKSEFFTIRASENAQIIGQKGTKIKFEANSIVHQNGTPVVGNIQIELKEVFSKRDMVLSNMPTVSNGKLLKSQGEFYINATQNGKQLSIKSGNTINAYVPNFTNAETTMLFRGDSIPNDSTPDPTDTIVNWTPIDSTMFTDIQDSSQVGVFVVFFSDFGWINCDVFMSDPNAPILSVDGISGFDYENGKKFIVFKNTNTVAQMFTNIRVPIGEPVYVLFIGYKDNQLYFCNKEITVSENQTINLNPIPTSYDEIILEIDKLNSN